MMNYNRIYKDKMAGKGMKQRGNLEEMDKRGQVTIFIIVGLVIVAGILVYTLWLRPTYFSEKGGAIGFEGCVGDVVEQSIRDIGSTAGFVDPEFSYKYNGEEIGYLCYTNDYHVTCTIQKPFLKQHFQEQLKRKVGQQINLCYENSIDELRAQGYDVSAGSIDFNISIVPSSVRVEIEAPTTVGGRRVTRFGVDVNSPIYEILMVSTSILQFEVEYGDADTSSMMFLYPNLIIDKLKRSDGTTIYMIEDKLTKTKFQFASRSIAWPPGFVGQ
jgi:hypothetical protein